MEGIGLETVGIVPDPHYEAVPRVTYTDPQAGAVGAVEAPYSATAPVSEVPKTATYTHACAGYDAAVMMLRMEIMDQPRPVRPIDSQMASLSA